MSKDLSRKDWNNMCEEDKFIRLNQNELLSALLFTLCARNVVENNSFSPALISCLLKTDVLRGLKIFAKFRGNPRIDVTKFPSHVWISIFNMDERSRCARVRKYPSSIDNRLNVSLASNETVLDSSRLAPSWNSSFSLPRSLARAEIYPRCHSRSQCSSFSKTLKLTSPGLLDFSLNTTV